MALIKCSECGGNLSSKAKVCPHCGCPIHDTLIDTISDARVKEIIKQQPPKPKGELQDKEDYLFQNGLYSKEYAPIVIKGECYAVDDVERQNLIKFEKTAAESDLKIGDIIAVKRQGGSIDAVISKISFSDGRFDNSEMTLTEYSRKYNIQRSYKKIPYDLNEQEYQAILALGELNVSESNQTAVINEKEMSGIVTFAYSALVVMGVLTFIFGFIAGCFLGEELGRYGFSFGTAFSVWVGAFVIGTLEIGFAVVIGLLNQICKKD